MGRGWGRGSRLARAPLSLVVQSAEARSAVGAPFGTRRAARALKPLGWRRRCFLRGEIVGSLALRGGQERSGSKGEGRTEAVGSRGRCCCPLLAGGGRGRPGVGFPQRQPIFLHSLMEPEQENTERPPKRGRKRRQAPSQLGGAAEAMRAGWEREERRPQVKVSNGGSPAGRPGALWSRRPSPRRLGGPRPPARPTPLSGLYNGNGADGDGLELGECLAHKVNVRSLNTWLLGSDVRQELL